jgi:hypothetical protein
LQSSGPNRLKLRHLLRAAVMELQCSTEDWSQPPEGRIFALTAFGNSLQSAGKHVRSAVTAREGNTDRPDR